ncbi:MAG: hypothetical protein L0Z47_09410 [Actinobacteria bacterium]|nr:hypothetical protein [Actinomycetota bacterium]
MSRRITRVMLIAMIVLPMALPATAVWPFTLRENGSIICGSGKLRSQIRAYGDHQHKDNELITQFDFAGGEHTTQIVLSGATTWNWKLYNQTGYLYYAADSWATCTV